MIIYGSGEIVNILAGSQQIDEYWLWVHPVLLGKGKPLFKKFDKEYRVKLFKTKTFSSGVVILYYRSQKDSTD
jgi:dihydrofolate reductase